MDCKTENPHGFKWNIVLLQIETKHITNSLPDLCLTLLTETQPVVGEHFQELHFKSHLCVVTVESNTKWKKSLGPKSHFYLGTKDP